MRDFAEIEAELRFAADNGCDHTILIEAADALAAEDKLIQKLSSIVVRNAQIRITVDEMKETADQVERSASEKSGKTVYIRANTFTQRADLQRIKDDLNIKSEDKIIVLPCCMEILNPEELEAVKTKILGE